MKKLLFVCVLGAFTACGNGGAEAVSDSTSVMSDSGSSMSSGSAMSADSSSGMTDTSKTGADTGTMSTPH